MGTNAGSTPSSRRVSAVPGPTAAIFGRSPRARETSSRAPFGLVTITHSYASTSTGPESGSIRISGQATTS